MAHVAHHRAGSPSWVQLSTFDPDGAARFYAALFDWSIEAPPSPTGAPRICRYDGHPVAGIGSASPPDQSPRWLTYMTVDDAHATSARIVAAGGALIEPPNDLDGAGTSALAADPGGAMFAVWQTTFIGAGIIDEPNAVCWFELTTREKATAIAFYDAVFEWRAHHHGDEAGDYVEFYVDDESVAGLLPMAGSWADGRPNFWMVYFAVDDVDHAVARVVELGGGVIMPPSEMLPGRFAVVTDPQGATFSVLTFHPDAA